MELFELVPPFNMEFALNCCTDMDDGTPAAPPLPLFDMELSALELLCMAPERMEPFEALLQFDVL